VFGATQNSLCYNYMQSIFIRLKLGDLTKKVILGQDFSLVRMP
jgi:hypothetical protein